MAEVFKYQLDGDECEGGVGDARELRATPPGPGKGQGKCDCTGREGAYESDVIDIRNDAHRDQFQKKLYEQGRSI